MLKSISVTNATKMYIINILNVNNNKSLPISYLVFVKLFVLSIKLYSNVSQMQRLESISLQCNILIKTSYFKESNNNVPMNYRSKLKRVLFIGHCRDKVQACLSIV